MLGVKETGRSAMACRTRPTLRGDPVGSYPFFRIATEWDQTCYAAKVVYSVACLELLLGILGVVERMLDGASLKALLPDETVNGKRG